MRKDDINICKVYLKEANVGQNIRAGLGTLQRGLQNAVRGVGQAFNDQKTQTVLSDLVDKIVKDIKPINPNVNKTAVANALKTVVAANPAQAGGANTGGSGKRPPQAFTSNQASTTSNPPASTGGSTNPPASTGTSNPPASTGGSNPLLQLVVLIPLLQLVVLLPLNQKIKKILVNQKLLTYRHQQHNQKIYRIKKIFLKVTLKIIKNQYLMAQKYMHKRMDYLILQLLNQLILLKVVNFLVVIKKLQIQK
ncbi:MAG: hypothetical protein EBQ92_00555 [Proteobacteria bacterium]|nr:hypothetical protein [Pseudomonadota bacterium]